MGSFWDLNGPLGPERWEGVPGAFTGVAAAGGSASLDPGSGDLALLGVRFPACRHTGPFPFAFRFCPDCGTPLPPPEAARPAESWSFPLGSASGLPAARASGRPDPDSRRELALPFPGRWTLFVAGTPPRLLALEGASGELHALAEAGAGPPEPAPWQRRRLTLPPIPGPRWGLAVVADAGGFVVPTAAGPLAVAVRPFATAAIGPAPGAGACLGSAAPVGDAVAVPVAEGLAVLSGGEWAVLPVSGLPAAESFAAPSAHSGGAFWAGSGGLLFAGNGGPGFRPWRSGFAPLLPVRPVRAADGTLHQLGLIDGEQCFEPLLPGLPPWPPVPRRFDRYLASAGAVSFIGNLRFREPWEPRRLAYKLEGAFLVPLAPFAGEGCVVAVCAPRGAMRSFTAETEGGEPTECRIAFAADSVVPTDLGLSVRARAAHDLAALVYRDALLVHDVANSRLHAWALRRG